MPPATAMPPALPATACVLQAVCLSPLFSKITGSWREEQKTFLPFSTADKISSTEVCLPGRLLCCQRALKESKQLQSLLCKTRCAHKVTSCVLVSSRCRTHFRWSCLHKIFLVCYNLLLLNLACTKLCCWAWTCIFKLFNVLLKWNIAIWHVPSESVRVFQKVFFLGLWTTSHKQP